MTDHHEPDRGLPTAGRRPAHTEGPPPVELSVRLPAGDTGDEATTRLTPAADTGDEPTLAQPPVPGPGAGDSGATPPSGPGETTRVIGPPPDDEPTVERPRPSPPEPGGATQRLWDPSGQPTRPVRPRRRGAPDEPAPDEPAPDDGSPDPVTAGAAESRPVTSPASGGDTPAVPPWRRLSSAGALIWVLLALFGFTLVVQLRSNDGDQSLATARQEDLVRILSDLEARDSRLQAEISALESSQRQLSSGVAGRQAALDEAAKRADELGLLAGTVPGRGPGLRISLDRVKASAVLNAVQELRGAGGEVMQIAGSGGGPVRVVASSYFVDADGGGIVVDGVRLSGPYTVDVIGPPSTMQPALQIPGGVVASVNSGGGSVTMEQRSMVEVTAVRKATTLQHARPVS